ncbi:MAG: SLC13 family permease [Phycisphaerae bacterium]
MTHVMLAAAGSHGDTAVPMHVTLVFSALLVGLIVCLALEEKLHAKKSIIAGVYALVCLFLGNVFHLYSYVDHKFLVKLPPLQLDPGHTVALPVYVPGIDWGVIALILGASLFVDVTSRSGLFTWIAVKLTKASRGDPRPLLWCYGVMTVVFSAVLNNVTAMIIVGSLTGVSLKKLGRMNLLLGFLLIEGLLTNIGGLLTLISSVPNIIVGTAAGISFTAFFMKSAPFVAVATVVTLALGAKLFGVRRLATPAERADAERLVSGFDENDGVSGGGFFWFSAVMLVLFILTIAAASVLPVIRDLGMSYVAMAFAAVMMIRYKATVDRFYQAVDWDLLGFFASLFVVINVMEHALVLDLIGRGLGMVISLNDRVVAGAGTGAILVASSAFSAVTDNIPLSAMLAKILQARGTAATDPLWWSVVFGCNLGGNLTPIGSASTLVAVTIIHKHDLKMSFAGFVKMAAPFAGVHIALATIYVLLSPI